MWCIAGHDGRSGANVRRGDAGEWELSLSMIPETTALGLEIGLGAGDWETGQLVFFRFVGRNVVRIHYSLFIIRRFSLAVSTVLIERFPELLTYVIAFDGWPQITNDELR